MAIISGSTCRLSLERGRHRAAKVKVPTIEGAVMLTVPHGAQSGVTLRIKGRGFTTKSGGRGDQLVTLQIRLPSDPAVLDKLAADAAR